MNDKLKDVIREEMEKVSKLLVEDKVVFTTKYALTKWLQSLQKINDVCKERNRY